MENHHHRRKRRDASSSTRLVRNQGKISEDGTIIQDNNNWINLRMNNIGSPPPVLSSSSSENLEHYQNDDTRSSISNSNDWSDTSASFNSWKRSSSSVDIDGRVQDNENESGASHVRDNKNNSEDNLETDRKFESILKDSSSVQQQHEHESGSSSSSNNNNSNLNQSDMGIASASEHDEQNDDHQLVNMRPQTGNHHHPTKATGMSVRCHCNLASCVTNNYMCKSERRLGEDGRELEAGCFVQELESESSSNQQPSQQQPSQQHGVSVPVWNGRVVTARRGCIELLSSREKQEMCSEEAGSPIHCCTQDMCNYPKSFYPSSSSSGTFHHVNNNRLTFDSSSSSSSGGLSGLRSSNGGTSMTPNLDHQVWLRAAVIAVPICGLMILVALIVVARRLLKSDEDYKDSDGRRIRRKFLPTHCPQQSPQQLQQQEYYPPPSMDGMDGGSNNRTLGFHVKPVYVKPVYVETSEYLLPPENNPCCSVCHQRLANSTSGQQSSGRSHHYERGDNNSFSFTFRKNSPDGNSETEELVNSVNSGGGSPLQNCHCGGEVMPTVVVSGLNRASGVGGYTEDCESNAGSFTSTTSSVQPYDFFSKIGLGGCRSATSDNGNPSHV